MNILALDSSSQAASCALLRDGALAGEFFLNTALTHSQTLLPMTEALLASAGVAMREIDLFAVSTGPGSFTGLRIGISAVKGMAMAMDRPCVAVSTLAALAENLAVCNGFIVPVMDARRAQVYTALFRAQGGAVARLAPDAALPVSDLAALAAQHPDEPLLLVGDGAVLVRETLPATHFSLAPETLRHQRAGSVARVAMRLAEQGQTCTAAALAPAYLRLPQAERERLAKLQIPDTP